MAAIMLTVLALLAWTALMFGFLGLLGVPAIEGAAEVAERTRLTIVGCWLLGLTVGAVTLVGLWRRAFDHVSRHLRLRLTASAYVVGAALVASAYWFGASGVLLFLGPPLAAGLLLLTAWTAPPGMRRRIGMACLGWMVGVALVGAVWWFAPRTVGVHLWTAWGAVTLMAAIWSMLPLLSSARRSAS